MKPEFLYDGKRNEIACNVWLVLAEENIAFARARYVAWWDTLELLRDVLNGEGSLATWRATGPSASRTRWIGS